MTENEKNEEEYEYEKKPIVKVILLGNTDTGKTSLINAYEGKQFTETLSTFGSQFIKKEFKFEDKTYIVQVWDTAGQEQFRSVNKIYIKGSHVVLYVYDVTNREGFEQIKTWLESLEETLGDHKAGKYMVFLLGNKIDLLEKKKEL